MLIEFFEECVHFRSVNILLSKNLFCGGMLGENHLSGEILPKIQPTVPSSNYYIS